MYNGSMREVCECHCSCGLVVLPQDKTAQQQCKRAAMARAAAALRGGVLLRAWRSWAGRHAEKALRRDQLLRAVGALLLPRRDHQTPTSNTRQFIEPKTCSLMQ